MCVQKKLKDSENADQPTCREMKRPIHSTFSDFTIGDGGLFLRGEARLSELCECSLKFSHSPFQLTVITVLLPPLGLNHTPNEELHEGNGNMDWVMEREMRQFGIQMKIPLRVFISFLKYIFVH